MKSLALKISMAVLSMIPLVAKAELIVLASPQSNDAYYAKMIDDIFDFHVDYAKKIIKNGDNIVVLMGKGVAALQKVGVLQITPLSIPRIDVLGVYPSIQTVTAQVLILLIIVASVAYNLRSQRAATQS